MKDGLKKMKKPLCGVLMFVCLLLLLGCTGTAETGGDLTTYCIQGVVLLAVIIAAGAVGEIFD